MHISYIPRINFICLNLFSRIKKTGYCYIRYVRIKNLCPHPNPNKILKRQIVFARFAILTPTLNVAQTVTVALTVMLMLTQTRLLI